MTISVDIYSDYVCPYCMLFDAALKAASHDLLVEINRKPVELRPYPNPTLRPEDDYLPSVWNSSVYPLADSLQVPIRLPSISPQPYSRLAHEGAQFAERAGKADSYNERIFIAFFQEDKDIGDLDVLTSLASEIGLDDKEFRMALESGEHMGPHQDALKEAAERGIHSVPSVWIDGKPMLLTYDASQLRGLLLQHQQES